jgi:hypothetical protein
VVQASHDHYRKELTCELVWKGAFESQKLFLALELNFLEVRSNPGTDARLDDDLVRRESENLKFAEKRLPP